MMQVIAPAAAFAATLVVVWLLTRKALARLALDRPNERSLHATPTPRSGGVGIQAGVWLGWVLGEGVGGGVPVAVLWATAALALMSVLDDICDLPVLLRFGAHLLAAAAVCVALLSAGSEGRPWLLIGALTLVLAWMANAYNFMDGADGLAGGMAVAGFLCYGVAAHGTIFATANFCIAAAAAAFLIFNFAPARIFMGDAGSVPLGFLAASLGLAGWVDGRWPWWFPPLVFAPFLFDATLTLVKRTVAGEAVWRAHRDHTYQHLVRMGWSHRRLALAAYVLMALCGGAALLALAAAPAVQLAVVAGLAALHLALAWRVAQVWQAWQMAQAVQAVPGAGAPHA